MESLKEFAGETTVYCLGVLSAVALIKLMWTSTLVDELETASDSNLVLQTAPPPAAHVPQTESTYAYRRSMWTINTIIIIISCGGGRGG